MEVMFTKDGENPGMLSRVLARRGRKPAATRNCDMTLASKVDAHAEGSLFIR